MPPDKRRASSPAAPDLSKRQFLEGQAGSPELGSEPEELSRSLPLFLTDLEAKFRLKAHDTRIAHLLTWLETLPICSMHKVLQSQRVADTGKWFIKEVQFVAWTRAKLAHSLLLWSHEFYFRVDRLPLSNDCPLAGVGKSTRARVLHDSGTNM